MKAEKINVAIVDDHQIVIDGITSLLDGHTNIQIAITNTNASEMLHQLSEQNIDILLTDIMKEGSEVLVVSNDTSIFEKAFNCKLEDGKVWLDGCLSRKKQIIPFLEPAFA